MIEKIVAKNFKSLSFEQGIEQKNLVIGNNGSGKTARTEALILAVNGYVPGSGKQNADILDNFGDGKHLEIGFKIGENNFIREFRRSKKGAVSQNHYVNAGRVAKEDFLGQLHNAGKPKILDLSVFLDQSDQKKIDTLFCLFPPGEDLAELDRDIEEKKTRINRLHEMIRNNENLIQSLSRDKGNIDMPSGTLAEIKGQLQENDKLIEEAEADLRAAEIANAKEEADREAEAKAELKQIQEEETRAAAEKEAQEYQGEPEDFEPDPLPPYEFKELDTGGKIAVTVDGAFVPADQVIDSISKIINALSIFGKETALNVAKTELAKYKEGGDS